MHERNIPVIDLDPYLSGADPDKRKVADGTGWACENIGFLIIENHGVPQSLIDAAFAVSLEFFGLSIEEKRRYQPTDSKVPRGYQAFATRNLGKTLGRDTPPDLREQFFLGPLDPNPKNCTGVAEAQRFYAPNIWPDRPKAFREVLAQYYQVMEILSGQLMRVFALALDLPEHYFDDKIDHHFNTCPTNLYPVVDDPLPGQIRAGEHTDFGSLTILALNDAPGGLQVLMPNAEWLDVRPQPGQLIVNLGDMMARWTNDRWKSTLHRVVNPPDDVKPKSQRQSIGYFLHPNYDAEITALETCCGPDNPPKYAPIVAGEHMREKLERRVEDTPPAQ